MANFPKAQATIDLEGVDFLYDLLGIHAAADLVAIDLLGQLAVQPTIDLSDVDLLGNLGTVSTIDLEGADFLYNLLGAHATIDLEGLDLLGQLAAQSTIDLSDVDLLGLLGSSALIDLLSLATKGFLATAANIDGALDIDYEHSCETTGTNRSNDGGTKFLGDEAFLFTFNHPTIESNIILNPEFETYTTSPGAPDDWSVQGSSPTITKETTVVRGGSNSVKIVGGGVASFDGINQTLSVDEGGQYYVEVWTRTSGDPGDEPRLAVKNLTDATFPIIRDGTAGGTTWEKLSGKFFAEAGKSYHIELRHKDVSTGTIYFDDIFVAKLRYENHLENGSFDDYPTTPGPPEGWTRQTNGNPQPTAERVNDSRTLSGNCVLLTRAATGGNGEWLSQKLHVEAGKTYYFEAWGKSGTAGQTTGAKVRNSTDAVDAVPSGTTTGTDWVVLTSGTFTAGAGKNYNVELHVDFNGDAGAESYFDNIILEEVGYPDLSGNVNDVVPVINGPVNLVRNGYWALHDTEFWSVDATTDATVEVVHDYADPIFGNNVVKFTNTEDPEVEPYKRLTQIVPVEPDTEYLISYWFKTLGVNQGDQNWHHFQGVNRWQDGNHSNDSGSFPDLSGDNHTHPQWKRGIKLAKSNSDSKFFQLRIGFHETPRGEVWLGPVSVVKATEDLPLQTLCGGSIGGYVDTLTTATSPPTTATGNGYSYLLTSDAPQVGDAISFIPANGDYFNIPYDAANPLDEDFSVSFWIYLDEDPDVDGQNNWRSVVRKTSGPNEKKPWRVVLEEDLQFNISVTGSDSVEYRHIGGVFKGEQIAIHEWHHLAYSYDSSTGTMTAYLDGVQTRQGVMSNAAETATVPTGILDSNTDDWRISSENDDATPNGNGVIPGRLGELRAMSRPISAREAALLAASPFQDSGFCVTPALDPTAIDVDFTCGTDAPFLLGDEEAMWTFDSQLSDNLLENPFFEEWTAGTTSPPTSWNTSGDVTVEQEATKVFRGSFSAKITCNSNGVTGGITQALPPLEPNNVYTVICRTRTDGVAGENAVLRIFRTGEGVITQNNGQGNINTYTQNGGALQVTFFPTSSDNYFIQLFHENGDSGDVVYFDDVVVRKAEMTDLTGNGHTARFYVEDYAGMGQQHGYRSKGMFNLDQTPIGNNSVSMATIDSPAAFDTQDKSVSIWVYPTSVPTNSDHVIGNGNFSQSTNPGWHLSLRNDGANTKIEYRHDDATTTETFESTGNLTLNAWNHIGVTYDSATSLATLYFNGQVDSTKTFTVTPVHASRPGQCTFFGDDAPEFLSDNRFDGGIDHCHFFTRAITAAEMQQLYENQAPSGFCVDTNVSISKWDFDGNLASQAGVTKLETKIIRLPCTHDVWIPTQETLGSCDDVGNKDGTDLRMTDDIITEDTPVVLLRWDFDTLDIDLGPTVTVESAIIRAHVITAPALNDTFELLNLDDPHANWAEGTVTCDTRPTEGTNNGPGITIGPSQEGNLVTWGANSASRGEIADALNATGGVAQRWSTYIREVPGVTDRLAILKSKDTTLGKPADAMQKEGDMTTVTVTNAALSSTRWKNGYEWDGTFIEEIPTPGDLQLTGNMSILVVVDPDTTDSQDTVLQIGAESLDQVPWEIRSWKNGSNEINATIIAREPVGGDTFQTTYNSGITSGPVAFLFTRDTGADVISVWVNGVKVIDDATPAVTATPASAVTPTLSVGGRTDTSNLWDGRLYEWRIWDHVISDAEAAAVSDPDNDLYLDYPVGDEMAFYSFETDIGESMGPQLELTLSHTIT